MRIIVASSFVSPSLSIFIGDMIIVLIVIVSFTGSIVTPVWIETIVILPRPPKVIVSSAFLPVWDIVAPIALVIVIVLCQVNEVYPRALILKSTSVRISIVAGT